MQRALSGMPRHNPFSNSMDYMIGERGHWEASTRLLD